MTKKMPPRTVVVLLSCPHGLEEGLEEHLLNLVLQTGDWNRHQGTEVIRMEAGDDDAALELPKKLQGGDDLLLCVGCKEAAEAAIEVRERVQSSSSSSVRILAVDVEDLGKEVVSKMVSAFGKDNVYLTNLCLQRDVVQVRPGHSRTCNFREYASLYRPSSISVSPTRCSTASGTRTASRRWTSGPALATPPETCFHSWPC